MHYTRAAYDQKEPVSVLLSKAYILSRKLKIDEFSKWANNELNEYKNEDEVPDYRIVHGHLKAYNPLQGRYIPAHFKTEVEDLINKRAIRSTLAEIESLVEKGQENGLLVFVFPPSAQRALMEEVGYQFELSLHIPINYFERIREKVRSVILEWTLQLEEEGVYGEGMAFSKQEKEKAITPSVTIIGSMVNSQYQQHTAGSTQTLRIEEF